MTRGRYIINAADSDVIAPSGDYPGAGTVFRYQRPTPTGAGRYSLPSVETILAPGPTNVSVDIMVIIAITITIAITVQVPAPFLSL